MFDWFKKSTAMIRWGNSLSKKFSINASVRQGGLLTPVFIAIYVDTLIQNLSKLVLIIILIVSFLVVCFMLMIIVSSYFERFAKNAKYLQ